ncbi:hypothetical protein [Sphingomonas profundi]|uniref:hypothetical protein n=1 Tax=Alterirhizorhabdus profundi TaxID=2681549 RepID=UPI001E34D052|nr:hypothetical protein [Sphingomonas profundi]
MRTAVLAFAVAILSPGLSTALEAQMPVTSPGNLKKYNVTIRRFDPTKGAQSGQDFVLPVDSPDEEHAIASTIANAASWPGKVEGGRPLPMAFMAVRVSPR